MSPSLLCICCLEDNTLYSYINLKSCSHSDFLNNFEKPETDPLSQVICHQCHEVLKKIKLFKLQVEQSFKRLRSKQLDYGQAYNAEMSNHQVKFKKNELEYVKLPSIDTTDNNIQTEQQKTENNEIIYRNISTENIVFNLPDKTTEILDREIEQSNNDVNNDTDAIFNNNVGIQYHKKNEVPIVNTSNVKPENYFDNENIGHISNDDEEPIINSNVTKMEEYFSNFNNKNIKQNSKITKETITDKTNITTDYDETTLVDDKNVKEKNENLTNTPKKNKENTIKNIEIALSIINKNANNYGINLLVNSIQAITGSNVIGTISNNGTGSTSLEDNMSIERSYGFKVPVKEEIDMDIDEDIVEENGSTSTKCEEILKITVSKEDVIAERVNIAQSNAYLSKSHRCTSCLIGFQYKENLIDHMNRKHKKQSDSVTCEICQQVINPTFNYSEHIAAHYTRYKCRKCDKLFVVHSDAKYHYENVHIKKRRLKKGTKNNDKSQKHKYICKHCHKCFKKPLNFEIHMMRMHLET